MYKNKYNAAAKSVFFGAVGIVVAIEFDHAALWLIPIAILAAGFSLEYYRSSKARPARPPRRMRAPGQRSTNEGRWEDYDDLDKVRPVFDQYISHYLSMFTQGTPQVSAPGGKLVVHWAARIPAGSAGGQVTRDIHVCEFETIPDHNGNVRVKRNGRRIVEVDIGTLAFATAPTPLPPSTLSGVGPALYLPLRGGHPTSNR